MTVRKTISVIEARTLIGNANKQYTDEQIEEIILILNAIVDIAIDDSIAKHLNKQSSRHEQ